MDWNQLLRHQGHLENSVWLEGEEMITEGNIKHKTQTPHAHVQLSVIPLHVPLCLLAISMPREGVPPPAEWLTASTSFTHVGFPNRFTL